MRDDEPRPVWMGQVRYGQVPGTGRYPVPGTCPSNHGFDVFYLFLQKQIIALRHIPFGYSPPRTKEAHVMMLPP
jgi:hypothetical protein